MRALIPGVWLVKCRYIGSVALTDHNDVDTLRPTAEAAGTDIAASLLAERFALPESNGLQQLCSEVSSYHTADSAQHATPNTIAALDTIPHEIASSLVTATDRASAAASRRYQPSLCSESFVPHVMHQFIVAATAASSQSLPSQLDSSSRHSPQAQPDMPQSKAAACQLAFMADVCGRFCRRGHVKAVARSLWQHMLQQAHQQEYQSPEQAQQHSQHEQQHSQHEQQQFAHHQQDFPQQQQQQQQQQQHEHQDFQIPAPKPHPQPPTQQAVCGIIHAIQDAAAVNKLLTALLEHAAADFTQLDTNLALMQCVLQPMWKRNAVRQVLPLVLCVVKPL